MIVFYIALGGAAGAVARYGLGSWVHAWTGTAFPWGTFVVNVTGSFLIGFVFRTFDASAATPELRALATTGLLSAFTTFSAFSYETVALLEDRQWGHATLYALGSVVLGVVAVLVGVQLASAVLHARG